MIWNTLCLIALALSLISSPADAQTAAPIRIGVLHDLTGPLTQQGTELNEGIRLHMSEIASEVSGRRIELFFEDTESKADAGVTKTRKLVERDPSKPEFIQTVWGFGYVFVPDGGKREE